MEPTKPVLDGESTREFKASDVRDAAGLSYRQLNDWDSKGAVPSQREGGSGWRRFSTGEVFALMVCSEIRKRFGVPVESLSFVRSRMLEKGSDRFRATAELMHIGLNVWLLTDLHETFVMEHDLGFEDLLSRGFFRAEHPGGFVFLRLNPLVNRLLGALKPPIQLVKHDTIYKALDLVRSGDRVQSENELLLLGLLRNRDYKRVAVELKDGEIVSATAERELAAPGRVVTDAEIAAIIRSRAFQKVTLTMHDGKTVRFQQSISFSVKAKHKSTPARRASGTPRQDANRPGRNRAPKTT